MQSHDYTAESIHLLDFFFFILLLCPQWSIMLSYGTWSKIGLKWSLDNSKRNIFFSIFFFVHYPYGDVGVMFFIQQTFFSNRKEGVTQDHPVSRFSFSAFEKKKVTLKRVPRTD